MYHHRDVDELDRPVFFGPLGVMTFLAKHYLQTDLYRGNWRFNLLFFARIETTLYESESFQSIQTKTTINQNARQYSPLHDALFSALWLVVSNLKDF